MTRELRWLRFVFPDALIYTLVREISLFYKRATFWTFKEMNCSGKHVAITENVRENFNMLKNKH